MLHFQLLPHLPSLARPMATFKPFFALRINYFTLYTPESVTFNVTLPDKCIKVCASATTVNPLEFTVYGQSRFIKPYGI